MNKILEMQEALDLLSMGRKSNIENLTRLLNEEVARVEAEELESAKALVEHLGIKTGNKVVITNKEGENATYYFAGFEMDDRVIQRLGKKRNIRYDLRKIKRDGSMGVLPMVRHSVLNPINLVSIAPFKEVE